MESQNSKPDFGQCYQDYLLSQGKEPASVYQFCKEIGVTEAEFYKEFASFEALNKHIWFKIIQEVLAELHSQESYASSSARVKMLDLFNKIFVALREQRSFVVASLEHSSSLGPCGVLINRSVLGGFKPIFREEVKSILLEGKEKGEVISRPVVGSVYGELFWKHFLCLLLYWIKDDSAQFERSTKMIEKTVNISFDLLGRGVSDGVFDLVRSLTHSA